MKICLKKKSYFTFRGQLSFDLDILGKTVYELMSENLIVKPDETEDDGVVVLLETVYPFVSREELISFLEEREGSYYFKGGCVIRKNCPLSKNPKLQTVSLGQGIFSLSDYAEALAYAKRERIFQLRERNVFIENGAEISYIATVREGAIIKKDVRIIGNCYIGKDVVIEGNSQLRESVIGDGTTIFDSVLDHAKVGKNCTVGPFAYLRPKSVIGDECRIGDFVEIKNSRVGNESKTAHHAYVGDAEIGDRVNVGCGVVFANYNGREKSRTKVGNDVFIGSNCNLIAPIEINDGAYLAAGTTVTCDLEKEDFCIGRCRETIKPLRAKKYRK